VFRSWGRVGVKDIGGNKLENYRSVEAALEQFNELYEERTGLKNRRQQLFCLVIKYC